MELPITSSTHLATAQPASCLGVSVLGRRFLRDERVLSCIHSWKNIHGISEFKIISDGSLKPEDTQFIKESFGFEVFNDEEIGDLVEPQIKNLKYISRYLKEIKHYRKAIYSPLLSQGFDRCLLIDSDVLITEPICFPSSHEAPEILISPDDIPAYRLHWSAGFRIPLAPCINSGFVYFQPSSINLEYLESVFEQVQSKSQNKWWVEQGTWAIYCGYVSSKGLFDGHDARVVSGLGKRTASEIMNNEYVWHRKSKPNQKSEIAEMIKGAAVIHFAGPGKQWIDLATTFPNNQNSQGVNPRHLRWDPLQNASGLEVLLLTLRLAAIGISEKINK